MNRPILPSPARRLSAAVTVLAGFAFLLPVTAPHPSVAQNHPVMSNVVPDGGTGSIEGKVHSIDPTTRLLTIVSASGTALTAYAADEVRLDNIKPGDSVDASYMRTVLWVVTPASALAPQGATKTVGEVAHTPGGIGPEATQISGRVLKIDSAQHSFDFVDASGGGVYTIAVVDPKRLPMLSALKVGNAVTVSISPLVITTMTECGWFGCS